MRSRKDKNKPRRKRIVRSTVFGEDRTYDLVNSSKIRTQISSHTSSHITDMKKSCALLFFFFPRTLASLPPAVGTSIYQPGEFVPKFTVGLLDNQTLSINTNENLAEQPLPLIVFALNPDDPWSASMYSANSSMDSFLQKAPKGSAPYSDAHYLFLAYDDEGLSTRSLRDALLYRMHVLGYTRNETSHWLSRLHFGAGGFKTWAASSPASILDAWRSPVNMIVMPSVDSAFVRLDGHYG